MTYSKEEIRHARNQHDRLNEVKDALAKEILARHDVATIRARGLSNLERWQAKGTWCSAYEEWRQILVAGSDEEVIVAMTDKDQHFVRLRQSPPYPGMLDEETRLRIWDEVMAKNLYDPLQP
jgi:hypothetical protein